MTSWLFALLLSTITLTPHGTNAHRLFVFLPGTGAKARDYQRILSEAQARGFAAIGIDYENRGPVNLLCGMSRDPNCWSRVRATRAADAEKNLRLTLTSLVQSDPAAWSAFYSGGAIVWKNIVIGGHSQGAGEAIWIAKEHAVRHVCGFDSPSDGNNRVPVAAWLSAPSATPASSIVIATNSADEISRFAMVAPNARALGLPAANFIAKRIDRKGYLGGHDAIAIDPAFAAVRAKACF